VLRRASKSCGDGYDARYRRDYQNGEPIVVLDPDDGAPVLIIANGQGPADADAGGLRLVDEGQRMKIYVSVEPYRFGR
jgi:hypothetical protein